MIEEQLKRQNAVFAKTKIISGRFPAVFWLRFIKKNLLVKQPWKFNPASLIFLVPILIVIFYTLSFDVDGDSFETLIIVLVFVTFFCFAIYGATFAMRSRAFVHSPTFHHLARFIVHLKGDVLKEVFHLSLDATPIENDKNEIDPATLGIIPRADTKYKPFQLLRYVLKFRLKDGSSGIASLHQISMRATSTRRRSSGKKKTKMKHKHKFFYQLMLTVPKELYHVISIDTLNEVTMKYSITIKETTTSNIVKIKHKEKIPLIVKKIVEEVEDDTSYYTAMMEYLFDEHIIVPTNANEVSQQIKVYDV